MAARAANWVRCAQLYEAAGDNLQVTQHARLRLLYFGFVLLLTMPRCGFPIFVCIFVIFVRFVVCVCVFFLKSL